MSTDKTRVWHVQIKPSRETKISGFFPGKVTVMADNSIEAMKLIEKRFGGWRVLNIEEVCGNALIWEETDLMNEVSLLEAALKNTQWSLLEALRVFRLSCEKACEGKTPAEAAEESIKECPPRPFVIIDDPEGETSK